MGQLEGAVILAQELETLQVQHEDGRQLLDSRTLLWGWKGRASGCVSV